MSGRGPRNINPFHNGLCIPRRFAGATEWGAKTRSWPLTLWSDALLGPPRSRPRTLRWTEKLTVEDIRRDAPYLRRARRDASIRATPHDAARTRRPVDPIRSQGSGRVPERWNTNASMSSTPFQRARERGHCPSATNSSPASSLSSITAGAGPPATISSDCGNVPSRIFERLRVKMSLILSFVVIGTDRKSEWAVRSAATGTEPFHHRSSCHVLSNGPLVCLSAWPQASADVVGSTRPTMA